MLIDCRHKTSITNVRSIRNADCGSDHHLVLVNILQRLAMEKEKHKKQKPLNDFMCLKDKDKAREFQQKLTREFDISNHVEKSIDD